MRDARMPMGWCIAGGSDVLWLMQLKSSIARGDDVAVSSSPGLLDGANMLAYYREDPAHWLVTQVADWLDPHGEGGEMARPPRDNRPRCDACPTRLDEEEPAVEVCTDMIEGTFCGECASIATTTPEIILSRFEAISQQVRDWRRKRGLEEA